MSSRTGFRLLLAGVALLLLVPAGGVPLFDPDEARFARTSVEMMRSGDLVVPHFEGQPRLVKPPLMHWIQSSLFRLLGVGELAARLHAALATLGSLALVGWVARRRFGDEAAVWAAAILATMPIVLGIGTIGTTDALLAVHVFAAIALDLGGDAAPRGRTAYALGAILGLAFLVKGPVGVIVPLLAILAGRTAAGRDVLPSLGGAGKAVLAGCLVVLPWAVAFVQRVAPAETLTTLRTEVFDRYVEGHDHVEPAWYFLPVLAVGMLPWCAPLLVACVRLVRHRGEDGARTALYSAAALVAGVVFFSLGRSKLPTYVLPLAPLAALVVTWQIGSELKQPERRSWGSLTLIATLGLLAGGLGFGAGRLSGPPRFVATVGAVLFLAAGLLAAWAVALRPRWGAARVAYGAAAAATAGFTASALLVLVPHLAVTRTAAYLVREVPELSGATPVAVVDMKVPSLTYYLDTVPEQIDMAHLAKRLERSGGLLLVFDEDDLPSAPPATLERLTEVGRQGKYVVYRSGR